MHRSHFPLSVKFWIYLRKGLSALVIYIIIFQILEMAKEELCARRPSVKSWSARSDTPQKQCPATELPLATAVLNRDVIKQMNSLYTVQFVCRISGYIIIIFYLFYVFLMFKAELQIRTRFSKCGFILILFLKFGWIRSQHQGLKSFLQYYRSK